MFYAPKVLEGSLHSHGNTCSVYDPLNCILRRFNVDVQGLVEVWRVVARGGELRGGG